MVMNKKGADVPTVVFIIVMLLAIGLLFFFTHDLTQNIFDKFGDAVEGLPQYDENTTAVVTIRDIESANTRVWDYGFLAIALASVFVLGLSAFSTRISPIFYWVYAVMAILMFTLAVMMSNIWQEMAATDAFASTLTNFPITNALLGTYYPTLILSGMLLGMILLFGKPRGTAAE